MIFNRLHIYITHVLVKSNSRKFNNKKKAQCKYRDYQTVSIKVLWNFINFFLSTIKSLHLSVM